MLVHLPKLNTVRGLDGTFDLLAEAVVGRSPAFLYAVVFDFGGLGALVDVVGDGGEPAGHAGHELDFRAASGVGGLDGPGYKRFRYV